jgi:SAM-dependent methyltransferase
VSTNTIYFIPDLSPALLELSRVLRPGGRLVLGVGDPDAMAEIPFTKHGFRLRPIGEIVKSLQEAGFSVVAELPRSRAV